MTILIDAIIIGILLAIILVLNNKIQGNESKITTIENVIREMQF